MSDLTEEEESWITNWRRHAQGDWGSAKDGTGYTGGERHLRMQLARMQRIKPRAFRWLVLNDDNAARIAARGGLDETSQGNRTPTPDEIEAVEKSAAAVIAAMQGGKASNEPSHNPITLTPEELIAARNDAGIDLPPPQPIVASNDSAWPWDEAPAA